MTVFVVIREAKGTLLFETERSVWEGERYP